MKVKKSSAFILVYSSGACFSVFLILHGLNLLFVDVLNLKGTPLKYDTVAQFPCDLDGAFAVYINSKKQELLNVIMWCDKNTTEKMIELVSTIKKS